MASLNEQQQLPTTSRRHVQADRTSPKSDVCEPEPEAEEPGDELGLHEPCRGLSSADDSNAVTEAVTEALATDHERQISELTAASGSSWRSHEGAGSPSQSFESRFESPSPSITSVPSWGVEEVAMWMRSVGLAHCTHFLKTHGVTGSGLLQLNSSTLSTIGVKALGDRKRILKAIRQLEVDAHQVAKSSGGVWARHLMFMAASPLVQLSGAHVHRLHVLDVEAELKAISNAIANTDKMCRFQHVYAKVRTLSWAVLHQSCCVLIFSGHTLPNGEWLLETESGEALPFDPGNLFHENMARAVSGGPYDPPAPAFFAGGMAGDDLGAGSVSRGNETSGVSCAAALGTAASPSSSSSAPAAAMSSVAAPDDSPDVPVTKTVLAGAAPAVRCQLVCIHARHPEVAAERFIKAGVPHVITLERQEDRNSSEIGAIFLESLCRSLLQEKTVQQSFDAAKYTLNCWSSSTLNSSRASSLSSLPIVGGDSTTTESVLPTVTESHMKLLPLDADHSQIPLQSLNTGLPHPALVSMAPGHFPRTGLETSGLHRIEMWRVLRALRFRRLVQVLGPWGVGKRMLVCLVAEYAWRRHLFPAGVHYVNIADLCVRGPDVAPFLANTPSLLGHKLLILDGCEQLYEQGLQNDFVAWISRLLTENSELQLLLTASTHLPTENKTDPLLGDLEDYTVELPTLFSEDAQYLLHWRLKDKLQFLSFVQDHGAAIVEFCCQLPFLITLFAGVLTSSPAGTEPVELLTRMQANLRKAEEGRREAKASDTTTTSELVCQTLLELLPQRSYDALLSLASLPARFTSEEAIDCLTMSTRQRTSSTSSSGHGDDVGFEQLLSRVKDRGFVQIADDVAVARMLTTSAADLADGSSHSVPLSQSGYLCLHHTLRRYLRKEKQPSR